jgi:hypothetical protein
MLAVPASAYVLLDQKLMLCCVELLLLVQRLQEDSSKMHVGARVRQAAV